MHNIGGGNVYVLRKLLERKFAQQMKDISGQKGFKHDFRKADPTFRLVIEVNAHEFGEAALEDSVSRLETKLKRLQQRYDSLKAKYEPAPKIIPELIEQLQLDADEDERFIRSLEEIEDD